MKWILVATVITATALGDLLQSWEMKRHGEVTDFRPGPMGKLLGRLFHRAPLILAVACMAVGFFAFLRLLQVADLSFAVPATAGSLVLETLLAQLVLKERVQGRRWMGACLVACGVALLAGS